MKNWIVIYEPPGAAPGLGFTGVLHEKGCHYLRPSKSRPWTKARKATAKELRTGHKCKVC
jgi:hypothetical protein